MDDEVGANELVVVVVETAEQRSGQESVSTWGAETSKGCGDAGSDVLVESATVVDKVDVVELTVVADEAAGGSRADISTFPVKGPATIRSPRVQVTYWLTMTMAVRRWSSACSSLSLSK